MPILGQSPTSPEPQNNTREKTPLNMQFSCTQNQNKNKEIIHLKHVYLKYITPKIRKLTNRGAEGVVYDCFMEPQAIPKI